MLLKNIIRKWYNKRGSFTFVEVKWKKKKKVKKFTKVFLYIFDSCINLKLYKFTVTWNINLIKNKKLHLLNWEFVYFSIEWYYWQRIQLPRIRINWTFKFWTQTAFESFSDEIFSRSCFSSDSLLFSCSGCLIGLTA